MQVLKMADMTRGWFVGDFNPTAFKCSAAEVAYLNHPAGQQWDAHYHKIATEVNFLVRGRMKLNDTELVAGDIFVIEPNEVATPMFIEDCEIVCVKVPSVPGDKYVVKS